MPFGKGAAACACGAPAVTDVAKPAGASRGRAISLAARAGICDWPIAAALSARALVGCTGAGAADWVRAGPVAMGTGAVGCAAGGALVVGTGSMVRA
jgi:hypothetical protein